MLKTHHKQFLVILLLTSCSLSLISPYDDATVNDTLALYKAVDTLLTQWSDTLPTYEKKTYNDIRVTLDTIYLRNEIRPNNSITIKQLDILRNQLNDLENRHVNGTLNKAMIGPYKGILEQTFRSILGLEVAKKGLK